MRKKVLSVAALWLALVVLAFAYTDQNEYTWRFEGEALSQVLLTEEEAQRIENEAQALMDAEKAEALVRSENGEWGKKDMYAGAPKTRSAVDDELGLNLMWGRYDVVVSYASPEPFAIRAVSALRASFIEDGEETLEAGEHDVMFCMNVTDACQQLAFACDLPAGAQIDGIMVKKAESGILDRDLAARLQTHPFLGPKLTIYQQDAMTFNFGELAEKMGQPLRVFGNLPYNISTPLMFHLFSYTDAIADMHFMLQKEVVNRLVAGPNSKAYGRLSVMAQYYCNVIPVLEVPPSAFTPPPKVDSAVVRLVPHATMPHPVKDVRVLSRITTEAFNQRRKTIRNSLGNLFSVEVLTGMGIDPSMRAENISVAQYCQMANYLAENAPLQES